MFMQSTDKQILIVEDNMHSMDKACALINRIDGVFIHKAENTGINLLRLFLQRH